MAINWAKAQNTERTVRRYWRDPGRYSRKMAESTGKFPPTPTLQSAAKQPMAAKFGEPAAIRPKTDVMPMVRLKASRRPNISPTGVSMIFRNGVTSIDYIQSPKK